MASAVPQIQSPNGVLAFEVTLDGAARYSVSHHGNQVVRGVLGVTREDSTFGEGLVVRNVTPIATRRHEDHLAHGKRLANREAYNEMTVSLRNAADARMDVEIRAYNTAVAFRYHFIGEGRAEYRVCAELTTFDFVAGGSAWMQPTQEPGRTSPAYENHYDGPMAIGSSSSGPAWNLPALFNPGDFWVLLAEADLDSSYFGAHLAPKPAGRSYTISLPNPDEGDGEGPSEPVSSLPWSLPWRVINVADALGPIVDSNLVQIVGRDCELDDPSWVSPGRVAWSWWSDNASPQDLSCQRRFVEFAAEMSWEHVLVDANWNVHDDRDVADFVQEARRKGVGVFLWYNSGGAHNHVSEAPRDLMVDRTTRRAEMERIAPWGVAGMKVDFFHRDKQEGIRLMEDIVRDAADFKLMVNFHGCTIPRGWSKRWPHLMTYEAVRGAETYLFDPGFTEAAAQHNAILPFTRNVIGPMDYTPVTFSDLSIPHTTTSSHELALAIVFESGLQHFADSVESYRRQDPAVIDILRSAPAVWDDTQFVAGYPGEYVVLARVRRGEWYVAGINGTAEPITVPVPLSFLSAGSYEALVVIDGENRDDVEVARSTVTAAAGLEVEMASRGGFAARLSSVGPSSGGKVSPGEARV